jgi:autotransporter-associated beta strand protein
VPQNVNALICAMALCLAGALLPSIAQAQSVWGGTGSTTTTTDYNLGTNWSSVPAGAPPVAGGQSAQFGATGTSSVVVTAGPIAPDSWTFNANSQSYVVTGAAVNFSSSGVVNNASAGQAISIANNMTGTTLTQAAASILSLTGTNSFTNTSVTGGTLVSSSSLTSTVGITAAGTFSNNLTLTGAVNNAGTFFNNGSGTVSGALTNSAGTTNNAGSIAGSATISGGTVFLTGTGSIGGNPVTVGTGAATATLDISGTTAGASIQGLQGASDGIVTLGSRTLTTTAGSAGPNFFGAINGSGGLTVTGGVLELSGANTYTGVTTINSGGFLGILNSGTIASSSKVVDNGNFDLSAHLPPGTSIKSLAGTGNVSLNSGITLTLTAASDTFAGSIVNAGGLTLAAGTETLTGTNTYTGATTINGGTLAVNGSIAMSALTTVNAGGTLSGTGTVGNTTINGGAFAPGSGTPGSSMTVTGNLAFLSGAQYLVALNPATSSFAAVTGTAALGSSNASVGATFAAGSYVAKQYTILTAGSVTGTFNPVVANTNLPAGFNTTLSYDPTHAYLDLALSFAPPSGGLNGNQQKAANAIVGFFNSNAGIPIVFGGLTPAGLTQISGETATGSQQTTFGAMTQFIGAMTDPFIGSRSDPSDRGSSATPFADEGDRSGIDAATGNGRTPGERDAYAMLNKAPAAADPFAQRWSVWAAGFGGSQTTDGNTTQGTNATTSRLAAAAVGADYRFSPDTIAGFALAGGGTNFGVNGFGNGRSDLFQAGAFVRHNVGPAYLTAALAYGWQDITTDRTVTVAGIDQLRARFKANAFSGRIEDGYRFVTPWMGVTPYAAGQFTTFDLPAYAEQAVVGANTFALAFNAKTVTDARSEIGVRTDKSWAMPDSIFTLRGRLAWAHDYNSDRSIAATFQTLPGASFVVNGAAQSPDKALTTASAEVKWRNGFSLVGTFEGEFSGNSSSYAGKGVARFQW